MRIALKYKLRTALPTIPLVGLVGRFELWRPSSVTSSSLSFAGTGTATATIASTAVVGVGTDFLGDLQPGDTVLNGSDTLVGTVATVTDGTNVVLTANAAVALTGAAFKVVKLRPRISQVNDLSSGANHLLQATAGKQPTYVRDANGPGFLTDGRDDFFKATAFTLAQPETCYLAFKRVTWVGQHLDGNTSGTMQLYDRTSSPTLAMFAGASAINVGTPPAVGTDAVVMALYNGASSFIRTNRLAATSGDLSSSTGAAGLTVGGNGNGSSKPTSNTIIRGLLVYNVAHDTLTQNRCLDYLTRRTRVAG